MFLQQDTLLPWASLHSQSSANSHKGQLQLPSAAGAFAFLIFLQVRFDVNTFCSGFPQRPERHHSRPWAPFQNLPRLPSIPASAQHRCVVPSCSQEDAPVSPMEPAEVAALTQCMGQVRGHGHARKLGGTEETSSAGGVLGFASLGGQTGSTAENARERSNRDV